MARKQGKIKAVPVKDVYVGMQVLFFDGRSTVVLRVAPSNQESYKDDEVSLMYIQGRNKSEFKTLVVEFFDSHFPSGSGMYYLPLKYSQWKSALKNEEVDSCKKVDFECVTKLISGVDFEVASPNQGDKKVYAKIIPPKKKIYTESEMVNNFVRLNINAINTIRENPNMNKDDLMQVLNDWALKNVIKR